MRAVVLEETGGPDQLAVQDVSEPVVPEGSTLVNVRAAAVNFFDVLVRRGHYPQPPDLPWIPGLEVAGETEDGHRVLGLVRPSGGGYAERVAIEDEWLFGLPDAATLEEGAAFLMAFLTAWLPLTRQTDVRTGARVLVTAAAGGVGSAAIQVARVLGAEVIAAAGSPEKLELARTLGASSTLSYEEISGVDPVDVVFDPVGGEVFVESIARLRPLGVAVAIGFAGGVWSPLDPALLVGRNVGVQGFYLGRLMKLRPDLVKQAAEDLLRLWSLGFVHPVVGATLPLDDAATAHRLVEERRSTGKVVLIP
jgi:NADPH2:quinone reductase